MHDMSKLQQTTVMLLLLATLLLLTNLVTLKAYHASRRDVERATSLFKQTAPRLAEEQASQAREYMSGVQQAVQITFDDLTRNLKLFREFADQSDQKLLGLFAERQKALEQLRLEPSSKSTALRVIEIDNEIIDTHRDQTATQNMHRKRLVEQLIPLAEKFGIKPSQ